MQPHPLLQLRLSSTHHGDTHHDVIASASGIRECDRGELFDRICALVPHLRERLSLTVADSVLCPAARLPELAEALAAKAVDADGWAVVRKVAA